MFPRLLDFHAIFARMTATYYDSTVPTCNYRPDAQTIRNSNTTYAVQTTDLMHKQYGIPIRYSYPGTCIQLYGIGTRTVYRVQLYKYRGSCVRVRYSCTSTYDTSVHGSEYLYDDLSKIQFLHTVYVLISVQVLVPQVLIRVQVQVLYCTRFKCTSTRTSTILGSVRTGK